MPKQDLSRAYFIGLLVLASFLMITFAWKFIHSLIFAFILSGILFPYHERLKEHFKIPRLLSAIIMSFLFVVLLLIPFIILVQQSFQEGVEFYATVNDFLNSGGNFFSFSEHSAQVIDFLAGYNINIAPQSLDQFLKDVIASISDFVFEQVKSLANQILGFVGNFFVMLLMMVGILSYAYKLKDYVLNMVPAEKHTDILLLIDKFLRMNRATVLITSFLAIVEGGLSGIAFALAGMSSPLLLGLIAGFTVFIPVIGITLVSVPVSYYLYLTGNLAASLSVLGFTLVVAFISENFVKSILIGKNTQINPILLLLSIIAGIAQFGVLGVFYGPLALSFFLTMVDIFNREIEVRPSNK